MLFDTLLGRIAIQSIGGKKLADVGRVVGLNFGKVATTVPSKGKNKLSTVLPNLSHSVNRLQVIKSAS